MPPFTAGRFVPSKPRSAVLQFASGLSRPITALETLEVVAASLTVNFAWSLRSAELRKAYAALRAIRAWRAVRAVAQALAVLALEVFVGRGLVSAWPSVLGLSWVRFGDTGKAPAAGTNLTVSGRRVPGFAGSVGRCWLRTCQHSPRTRSGPFGTAIGDRVVSFGKA
jgi:hypothetical protein